MMRHLGLTGKVIIIDECHSYDQYMDVYLKNSLEWLGGYKVPVLLLSATLPAEIRKEFINSYLKGAKVQRPRLAEDIAADTDWTTNRGYPLLTWTDGDVIHQTTIQQKVEEKRIVIGYAGKTEVMELLRERLHEGGCACVILNTVNQAQEYYQSIKESFPDKTVMLYHARFTMEDRLKKEKELMERMGKSSRKQDRDGFILVGTQVLEQSLDYDADIMFTQLCPMDLLLQRIGRLHRHERKNSQGDMERPKILQNPECIVILDGEQNGRYDEGSQRVYGDYLLLRTQKALPDTIYLPEDIPTLVQKVYEETDDMNLENEEVYTEAKQQHQIKKGKKTEKAKRFLLKKPRRVMTGVLTNSDLSDEEGNQSVRDADSSIEVILLKRNENGVCLLHSENEEKYFSLSKLPEEKDCINIARQRVRLPGTFSKDYLISKVIHELNDRQEEVALWKESSWLEGELFLILNSHNSTNLCGYLLYYDHEVGLTYQNGGEDNDGKGI